MTQKTDRAMPAVVGGLSGGLGNQMFQYAAARTLSLQLQVPLALDISWFRGRSDRSFDLANFRIDADTVERISWLPQALVSLQARVARHLSKKRFGLPVFKEKHFHFDADLAHQIEPVYLDGYWQSQRYFASEEEQIRMDFQLGHDMSADRQSTAHDICKVQSVSVHVRRGDYVSDPRANAHHGTCSPQWYSHAMSKIAHLLDDPCFYVFSDDPQWAQSNLPGSWPAVFIEPKADGRDFEDMHLMAMCNNHIIANSSFSWWGAWLNPSNQKTVIAPKHWFASGTHNTKDLLAASWIKV